MPFSSTNFSFFKRSLKETTSFSYESTKIGHDIRLGYSILVKSLKNIDAEIPSWQSASHLSYLLPSISFLCSLVNKDIALDEGALLWSIVNGLQCYILKFSNSKTVTLSAYSLDIYLGYVKDRKYSEKDNVSDACVVKYLKQGSETVYATLVLGNISANLFDQTDIGLLFFGVSLFLKIVLLTREQKLSFKLFCYSLIRTFAPLALLFSVNSEYNLVFNLLTLTLALYSLGSSPSQKSNSTQTEWDKLPNTLNVTVHNECLVIDDDAVVDIEPSDIGGHSLVMS